MDLPAPATPTGALDAVDSAPNPLNRRTLLKVLSMAGIASAVFARTIEALAAGGKPVTASMIEDAEWLSGLKLDKKQRKLMLEGMTQLEGQFEKLRAVPIDNGVAPALRLDLGMTPKDAGAPSPALADPGASAATQRPASDEDLAFSSVMTLSRLLRDKKVSSLELTRLYLDRLKRYDPKLQCVITYTEELALRQAQAADREIADGRARGVLHGIPWGAKDLLAVEGYKTTWGATPYRDQTRPETSTVVTRLGEAGSVLLAKMTVGELAWGDVWYGGTTKNPWKLDQGSSGSSAGSASATSAGLLAFAIGTETWGSIVSPCTRCGVSGLRPTFGRVSRHGTMALAWSMDKIGPIARSVEDLAFIFGAIHGADGLDRSVVDSPFEWPAAREPKSLKVGYVKSLFDEDYTKWADTDDEKPGLKEWQEIDQRTLETLRGLGIELVPIALPSKYPVGPLSLILSAEAATAFDQLTRSGRDSTLVRQVADAWPNVFRQGQMIPAVEYLRANRIRTLLMQEMEALMAGLDAYVVPSFGGDNLLMTNLTGHPAVVVPNGFRKSDGTPTSITFQGKLYGEAAPLSLALAFQRATDFHLKQPPLKGA